MKLSVIIVNYNVRAYLEQCLRTVRTALEGIDGEVYVVDNLSTDGSVEMVREKFPDVQLIANMDNVGFSRANNQAIRESHGEYVLLLNPDTVVGEDVFRKVLYFMDSHPLCGGLGVKMIDGTGRFLPESKRGLPTPQVAFFKMIGLTRLFPKSQVFGRYHLGHLPENEASPIEILSGACMFLRKKTLDEVGLLDESFFMYGEDIDLSYRITLGGYQNWYFPEARIIHYKGESTKKSSVNYVFVFYNAMAIFARKHFTQRSAGVFPFLINGSIYLSAAGAIAVRFLNRALLPILDLLSIAGALALAPVLPERWPLVSMLGVDILIATALIGWMGLWGGYDRPVRPGRPLLAMGSLFAILAIASFAFGDPYPGEEAVELAAAATFLMLLARMSLHLLRIKGYGLRRRERERVLVIGSDAEAIHALALLWQTHYGLGWTGVEVPEAVRKQPGKLLSSLRYHRAGEVVFCAKDMPWGEIIAHMEQLRSSGAELKIAQPAREFIIGPSSIESLQDLYLLDGNTLDDPGAKRTKRMLDIAVALLLALSFPLAAIFVRSPLELGRHIIAVLTAKRSWVGYGPSVPSGLKLPSLLPGILDPSVGHTDVLTDPLALQRLNSVYAKDYSAWLDLRILLQAFRKRRLA